MQFNTARRPPCCRDEEPEGPSLQDRIYGTDPEFLSGAKKVLYGAVAANTEREFVVACISAIWPWLTRGLLFSAADAIDDATGSIARALTPEAIESLAQGLGIAVDLEVVVGSIALVGSHHRAQRRQLQPPPQQLATAGHPDQRGGGRAAGSQGPAPAQGVSPLP